MKVHQEKNEIESSGDLAQANFGLEFNPKIARMLSEQVYSDPILAVVREYICNAWDAHTILPAPRDTKSINTSQKVVSRPLEDKIVRYINRHLLECIDCDITVRQVASALKVNNATIVANIGGKVFMYKNSRKAPVSLSNQRVGVKKAFKKEGI
jgi:hypothetical protein